LAVILQRSSESSDDDLIKKAIYYALDKLNNHQASQFIKRVLKEKIYNELKQKVKSFSDISELAEFSTDKSKDLNKLINEFNVNEIISEHRSLLYKNTPFKSNNDIGLLANGWVSNHSSILISVIKLLQR
jgi:hypothetical protein